MKIRNIVKRFVAVKGVLGKTFVAATLLAGTTTAFAQITSGQYYLIKSGLGNVYMSGLNGSADQKTRVAVSSASGKYRPSSIWKAIRNTDGTYSFENYKSEQWLDVEWANANASTPMHLWPRNGGIAQKFKLHAVGSAYYNIAPALNPSLRLDVHNGSRSMNTPVKTWHSNGHAAQKWEFQKLAANSLGLTKISRQTIMDITNVLLSSMRVKLDTFTPQRYYDSNDDVSWYVRGSSTLSFMGGNYPINIPEIIRGVRDKRYYVEDVNLVSARVKFSGNDLILTLAFEHNNQPDIKGMCSNCAKFREDNGAPDFRFEENRWEISLGLIPHRGSVAFNFNGAKFLGDIAGGGLGVRAEIAENRIVPAMSAAIRTAITQSRDNVAARLADAARKFNINVANVRHVLVDGTNVYLISS